MRAFSFSFLFLLAAPLSLAVAAPQDSSLPYRVQTCESEVDLIQKRLETMESLVDSLQSKLSTLTATSESSKGASQQKLALTDSSIERLSKELTSLRDYSRTTSDSFNALQKKFADLEQETKQNRAHAEKLETALRSLTKLLQGQSSPAVASLETAPSTDSTGGSTYKVKSGDSLGKIARANQTTVENLVKLNNLKPDAHIIVGQELKLP